MYGGHGSIGDINPFITNGLSRFYHLDKSTSILGASAVIFNFDFIFRLRMFAANEKVFKLFF